MTELASGIRYDIADECERRSEASSANPTGRSYDETSPSKLIHPNGTRLAVQHRELAGVMASELVGAWFDKADRDRERLLDYGSGEW